MKDTLLQIEEVMEQPEFMSPYAFIETSPINPITNVQLSTSRLFGRVLGLVFWSFIECVMQLRVTLICLHITRKQGYLSIVEKLNFLQLQ